MDQRNRWFSSLTPPLSLGIFHCHVWWNQTVSQSFPTYFQIFQDASCFSQWKWRDGYWSKPGKRMNINIYQPFWCEQKGVQGFDPYISQSMRFSLCFLLLISPDDVVLWSPNLERSASANLNSDTRECTNCDVFGDLKHLYNYTTILKLLTHLVIQ